MSTVDVAVGQRLERLRDDVAEQEGRDHPEQRRDDDQDGDDRELAPVAAEEPPDPAQVGAPHRLVGGALDLLAGSEAPRVSSGNPCIGTSRYCAARRSSCRSSESGCSPVAGPGDLPLRVDHVEGREEPHLVRLGDRARRALRGGSCPGRTGSGRRAPGTEGRSRCGRRGCSRVLAVGVHRDEARSATSAASARIAFRCGASAAQCGHQVAKSSSSTAFPFSEARLTRWPAGVRSEKAGAAVPGASWPFAEAGWRRRQRVVLELPGARRLARLEVDGGRGLEQRLRGAAVGDRDRHQLPLRRARGRREQGADDEQP